MLTKDSDPRDLPELMEVAALALKDADGPRLEALQALAGNWVQDSRSAASQLILLEAMAEAAYTLADLC